MEKFHEFFLFFFSSKLIYFADVLHHLLSLFEIKINFATIFFLQTVSITFLLFDGNSLINLVFIHLDKNLYFFIKQIYENEKILSFLTNPHYRLLKIINLENSSN